MGNLSFERCFRLQPGQVECDANGLQVGGVPLLGRDAKGAWTSRDERDLNRDLSKRFGLPLDFGRLRRGIDSVARALANGELARAQIAALQLRLPDPPASAGVRLDGLEKRRLARDLVACGLLKADADWEDKHPRMGAPPNPGWFAPAQGAADTDTPKTEPSPAADTPPRGDSGRLAFVPATPAAGISPLLAEDLSATALQALATLAARFTAATILFDAIFVPSDNRLVEEGRLPGRPDVAYRWAHDENATAVTLRVLVDGRWRILAAGGEAPNSFVYDRNGRAVARVVSGPDRRETLVATVGALDRAVADLRRKEGEPGAATTLDDREPRLCPKPMEEPRTMTSTRANAIAYQEYVSGLRYSLAIFFGGVWFDGCDQRTGFLLDAKAKNDHIFDAKSKLNLESWVYPENNPAIQMKRQSDVAVATGRQVVWHVQTEKTYLVLKKILDDNHFPNVTVLYDPN